YFIHGAQNGSAHAFREHVRSLAAAHPQFKMHISYSKPGTDDVLGTSHDAVGYVSIDTVKAVVPEGDCDFYLCGPPAFMTSLYDGLTAMGVPAERIHYESFGPATVLRRDAPAQDGISDGITVPVRFVRSNIAGDWSRDNGTLLEFAESLGIAPQFSCRSG